MVEKGAMEEVEALLARKLDPQLPVMRAIGVAELGRIAARRDARKEAGHHRRATGDAALCQAPIYLVRHQPPPDWPRFQEALEGDALDRALALLVPAE